MSFILAALPLLAPTAPEAIAVRWDDYGVPHVKAETERGAYYGAGFACARLRLFQMCFQRMSYRGRLAEVFGRGRVVEDGRNVDVYVEHDRKLRTYGLHGFATEVVAELRADADPERRAVAELLQAYADGVNAYVAQAAELGAWFDRYASVGLDPRLTPWEPEDSIGLLLRLAVLRGQDQRWVDEPFELWSLRAEQAAAPDPPLPGQTWTGEQWNRFIRDVIGTTVCDEPAASVQAPLAGPLQGAPDRRAFLAAPAGFLDRLNDFVAGVGPAGNSYGEPLSPYWQDGEAPAHCFTMTPPCSEAWAFDGRAMEDGAPILVAEPRMPLFVPSILVEWYMECADFRVRGAGLPGTPFLLVGASDALAWGISGLELDQVDLFQLDYRFDDHTYVLDGDRIGAVAHQERIWIAGEPEPVSLRVRETVFGPIVNHLLPSGLRAAYARRAVPLHDTRADGASAFVGMYRARTVRQFRTALASWTTPPASLVYSHRDGRVGFQAVGALPVRHPRQVVRVGDCPPGSDVCEVEIGPLAGWVAQDGTRSANLWGAAEIVPGDLMPHVEPRDGFVFTANNAPAGAWYPIPNRPGLSGHTSRSRRLVERLEALWREHVDYGLPIDAGQAAAPRTDSRLSTLADFVTLARWVADCDARGAGCPLTIDLAGAELVALEQLEGWLAAGATMAHAPPARPGHPALLLAYAVPLDFRRDVLVEIYGGGSSGLELFLADALCRVDSGAGLTDLEADWIRSRLTTAVEVVGELGTRTEQRDPCRLGPGDPALDAGDPSTWRAYLEQHVLARRIPHWVDFEMDGPYCESLGTAPLTLDQNDASAGEDVTFRNAFPDVLWGQPGQLFSQVTRYTDAGPVVTSMLMPEQAEPGHPALDFRDQLDLWESGGHKPGPMSLDFGCADGECETTTLTYVGR